MSVDDTIEGIMNYYDKLTLPKANEELQYYSTDQVRQIKGYIYESMYNWKTLDDRDMQHWKNFMWKSVYVAFLIGGISKVCRDEDLQKVIKWRPAWNDTQFVRFVNMKRGIPFFFVMNFFLIPDLSLNFMRPALKRYHIANHMKSQDQIEQIQREQKKQAEAGTPTTPAAKVQPLKPNPILHPN